MKNNPVINKEKNVGAGDDFILKLEEKIGQSFPVAYREFLFLGGEDANFMRGIDCGIYVTEPNGLSYVEEQQVNAREILAETGFIIPKPFWVFADSDSCQQFHFFHFDEGDNPPVYHFCSYMHSDDEGKDIPAFNKINDKFSQYIEDRIFFNKESWLLSFVAQIYFYIEMSIGKLKKIVLSK